MREQDYTEQLKAPSTYRGAAVNSEPFGHVDPKERNTGMEEVPHEKQREMIAYAKALRKKWPHMKPDRIKKKVAAYFKVKLV